MTTDTPSGRRHHIHLVDTAVAGRLRGKALCPRVEHDKSSGAGRISRLEGDFSTQQDPWLCPGTVRIIAVRPIRRLDRALGHAMAKLSRLPAGAARRGEPTVALLSPRIDAGPLFASPHRRGRHCPKGLDDPDAGVGRVDDIVDLEGGGHIEGLAVLVGPRHHALEELFAVLLVVHRFEFAADPQPNGTLETHAAELSGRPRHREQRGPKTPTGHRLCAQAISLPQDEREKWDREAGSGHEEATEVAHLPAPFRLGSHHEPRSVTKEEDGKIVAVTQLQEARRLIGPVAVDGTAE